MKLKEILHLIPDDEFDLYTGWQHKDVKSINGHKEFDKITDEEL